MIFGQPVTVYMLVPGGIVLAVLMLFQIAVGKRWIHFKGRTHMKVHTWTAYAMVFVLVGHGLFGLMLAYDITLF